MPPPSRIGRLLLRHLPRLGDADMLMLRWRLRWSWHARRLLKRHADWADVALVVTQSAALLSRAPMRRLPCVLVVDATVRQFAALEYLGPRGRFSPAQERIVARLEQRAIAAAAAVVPWSEWNAEALTAEYDVSQTRLATIHPGVDVGWWGKASARRSPREDGPLRILFVGNEARRKGLDLLLEAVERLGLDAVIDVVSGDSVPPKPYVRVHRGVEAGSERLRELFASADVFAFPTRADAVPWVVLEAMASGLPVVATRVGAIGEILGDAGELVEVGDVEGLTEALRRLSNAELRRRLGGRALARVRARYDSAVQTRRLLELLGEAAGRQGSELDENAVEPSPRMDDTAVERHSELGELRMQRRTFVALGAGAAGLLLASPYVALLPGDEFEGLVASKLGIEPTLARQLLAQARVQYGDAEYDARAAAFALAVRDPAATLMPDGVRRRAIDSLLEPMLSAPPANLAYAITGADPTNASCSGLIRTA